jgi:hypothetical protein
MAKIIFLGLVFPLLFWSCNREREFDTRKWDAIVDHLHDDLQLPQKNMKRERNVADNGMILYNKTATFQFADPTMKILDLLVVNGQEGAPKTNVSALVRIRSGLGLDGLQKVLNNIHSMLIYADNSSTERHLSVWFDAQISERGLSANSFIKERVFEENKTKLTIQTQEFTLDEFILNFQLEIIQ